ncbi:MAG: type I-B CRISPR-associated protein Cas7/Csh2 [Candidatus Lokiarchaeota archaeon]|nr:type I-B CRISPR-associated protein Cas7/Csh2 [Candidatus Lokiarchaeota archaeon]
MSKENEYISNRSEIIFIYETNNNNPNGDPLTENRPRMDEMTQKCMVSDVRLKRNIRDYLEQQDEEILISNWNKDDGTIKQASERALELKKGLKADDYYSVKDTIIEKCIDARLFGCAMPLGKNKRSIQLTGPVQFLYGVSEFPVQIQEIQGTAAFASTAGAQQRSFRNEFIIPFALIKFYGIINEQLAIETKLTKEDIDKLDQSIWKGTLNLQSRSKVGHKPRLYIRVIYKIGESQIGLIHQKVESEIVKGKDIDELRKIDDILINLDKLEEILKTNKNKIEKIIFKESGDLQFINYDSFKSFLDNLGFSYEEI